MSEDPVLNAVAMHLSHVFPEFSVIVDSQYNRVHVDSEFGNVAVLTFIEDHCLVERDMCERFFVNYEDPFMLDSLAKSLRFSFRVMAERYSILKAMGSVDEHD